jgi:tetratricopeptide (TPR) repeat protein
MLNRQRRFDAAHEALLKLRSNTNYKEFYGEIDFELGNVARDRGDIATALTQYAYVDTAYSHSDASTDANLALGMLYENVLHQFDSARVVYDRGRQGTNTSLSKPQILRRADYLVRYISYRNDILKLDSLRYAALHPPDTTASRRDSLASIKDSARVVRDSVRVARDSVRVDSTAMARADTTKRRPVVPAMTLDTINVRLANRMDDIAGLFYATMGLRDSSRLWYNRLLREYPDSRGAPRALYVLARIENEDSTSSRADVDSLYREIIRRFPGSPFAEESKRFLGLPATVKAPDPQEMSYTNATALLLSGKNSAAIDTFKSIVQRAPASFVAPRAQYAVGWTYEYNFQQFDSAAVNYERLVALYPGSIFAQRVQPRVAEMQAARQAALAPKVTDTTSVAPVVKKPEKVLEPADEEIGNRPRKGKTATGTEKPGVGKPGTEKPDAPIDTPDDRVLR